jgi:hypothetical protein
MQRGLVRGAVDMNKRRSCGGVVKHEVESDDELEMRVLDIVPLLRLLLLGLLPPHPPPLEMRVTRGALMTWTSSQLGVRFKTLSYP